MKVDIKSLMSRHKKHHSEVKVKYVSGMDLPPVLYKYREIHDQNNVHLRVIINQEFFLSSPASFSDSSDCNLPIRADLLSDAEIYNRYFRDSFDMNPNSTRAQRREWARKMANQSPIRDTKKTQNTLETSRKDFNERFGVISMTENPLNAKMWNEYSAQMTGFCVGVDPEFLEKKVGGFGKVTYYNDLPIIKPFDDYLIQNILQIYSKKREYEFEEEYRVSKFHKISATTSDRQVVLPPEAFKEVILGANISATDRKELITLTELYIPNVKLLQAEFNQVLNSVSLIEI